MTTRLGINAFPIRHIGMDYATEFSFKPYRGPDGKTQKDFKICIFMCRSQKKYTYLKLATDRTIKAFWLFYENFWRPNLRKLRKSKTRIRKCIVWKITKLHIVWST